MGHSFHVRSPQKKKIETAPPQILIKLYTLLSVTIIEGL